MDLQWMPSVHPTDLSSQLALASGARPKMRDSVFKMMNFEFYLMNFVLTNPNWHWPQCTTDQNVITKKVPISLDFHENSLEK